MSRELNKDDFDIFEEDGIITVREHNDWWYDGEGGFEDTEVRKEYFIRIVKGIHAIGLDKVMDFLDLKIIK